MIGAQLLAPAFVWPEVVVFATGLIGRRVSLSAPTRTAVTCRRGRPHCAAKMADAVRPPRKDGARPKLACVC